MSWRARIAGAIFAIVGVIHLLPGVVFFQVTRAEALYGVTWTGDDLSLLLRHRAVMLATIGVLLLVAVWRAAWRAPAVCAATISKVAFIGLVLSMGANAAIARVAMVDAITLPALLIAWWLTRPRATS